MKKILSKTTSTLLALLVLFSTFSFTVESHFCGDFLMDFSLIGEAEVCESDINADASIQIKECCSDEIITTKGQDELQQVTFNDLDLSNKHFLTSFFISNNHLFAEKRTKIEIYKNFSPPDIPIDYQVLHQTYLI